MSISYFTDRNYRPNDSEIYAVVGNSADLWDELFRSIRDIYSPVEDFSFLYGKNYGWGWRFKRKGKLLAAVYPSDGGFKVQIIFSTKAVETVLSLPYGKNVIRAIQDANPYPEGRWLFIPVETAEDLSDIYRLLELKNSAN